MKTANRLPPLLMPPNADLAAAGEAFQGGKIFAEALVDDMPAALGGLRQRGDRPLGVRMEEDGADIGLGVLRQQLAISALQVDLEQRALVASARVDEKDRPPVGGVAASQVASRSSRGISAKLDHEPSSLRSMIWAEPSAVGPLAEAQLEARCRREDGRTRGFRTPGMNAQ